MNDSLPEAFGGASIRAALPSLARVTGASPPVITAVRTSPSTSMSFSSSGSVVATPGRAPSSSSLATGGCCSSENSWSRESSVSSDSSDSLSSSSNCSRWLLMRSQLSTLSMDSSGRYTAPVARSLMTRTLRLALNTGLAAFASSGNWAASFSSASLQSRT